jgi:hypothetical protein
MRRLALCVAFVAVWVALPSADVPAAWSVQLMKALGGRHSLYVAGNLMVYDNIEVDGYFDVYRSTLTGASAECITCDHASLSPNKHIGNPRISHSGTHVALQVQNGEACTDDDGHPGQGGCNDIWVMRLDTLAVTKIIDVSGSGVDGGAIYCQWKPPSDAQIMCGVRTDASPNTWNFTICDIEIVGDASVSNCVARAPAPHDGFYEPYAWLPPEYDTVVFACV